MREILFRGKDEDGDWLKSMSLAPHITENGIITSYYIGAGTNTVAAETVGQYTGLTDKNGKKIFEGDIIVIDNQKDYPTLVKFCKSGWHCVIPNNYTYTNFLHRLENNFTRYEVIGNIHDNPELLEEGK